MTDDEHAAAHADGTESGSTGDDAEPIPTGDDAEPVPTADGAGPATPGDAFGPRSATIRSEIPNAATVAAAIAPDDTDDIHTRCADGAVVVDVERPTTASLEATVDDAVVALDVASTVAGHAGSLVDRAPHGPGAADEQHDDRPTDDTNTR